MTPPGWRTPAPSGSPQTYEHLAPNGGAYATSSGAHPPVSWPSSAMTTLGGALSAGLHVVAGPHGSGKTQLLMQTAVHNALMGTRTVVDVPHTPPREASLRVASVLSGVPWGELERRSPEESARYLERLQGAPITLSALQDDGAEALGENLQASTSLWILDQPFARSSMAALRAQAVGEDRAILWAVGSQHPVTPPDLRDPLGCAKAYGASDKILREADSVWVILPEWVPVVGVSSEETQPRLVLAKSRRYPQGYVEQRFNGARFEDP